MLDACSVAALIRETEALPSPRFIELRFERITIRGPLHLSDPRARLSFFDVNFVPAPPTNDAGGAIVIGSRSERTMSGASFGQPAPSKRETRTDTIGGGGGEGTVSDAAFAQPESPINGENAAAAAGRRNDQTERPERLLSEPLDPALAGSSVVIERSHFRDRVLFERVLFEGSVVVSGSTFTSGFDIVQSDVGGDLVFESSEFASNLELGHGTILRGQIVVDGVRVGGDIAIDGAR